jgi:hypothetical protein
MIGEEEPAFWRADALPHIGENFRSGPMDLTIAHSEHRRIDEPRPAVKALGPPA